MVISRRPKIALEFGNQEARRLLGLKGSNRRLKVARIGKPVGPERPQFRQPHHRPVVFAD